MPSDPTIALLSRIEAAATAGSHKSGGPERNEVLLALVRVARAVRDLLDYEITGEPYYREWDSHFAAIRTAYRTLAEHSEEASDADA